MRSIARCHAKLLAALALLCCWQVTAPALAKDLVSCRYRIATGTRIELELAIAKPPPATLIVTQTLPPEVAVIDSLPPVKKFSQKPGEAKWLILGIRSGITVIAMTLNKAVQAGQLGGEIVYTDPESGDMIRMPITP